MSASQMLIAAACLGALVLTAWGALALLRRRAITKRQAPAKPGIAAEPSPIESGHMMRDRPTRRGRAYQLVPAAQIAATGSFVPMLERFPSLRSVDTGDWDFFLTVAGVFIALSILDQQDADAERARLKDIISATAHDWDPNAAAAADHCREVFDKEFVRLSEAGHERRFLAADALGTWITLNLFQRPPSNKEDAEFVRMIGSLIVHVSWLVGCLAPPPLIDLLLVHTFHNVPLPPVACAAVLTPCMSRCRVTRNLDKGFLVRRTLELVGPAPQRYASSHRGVL